MYGKIKNIIDSLKDLGVITALRSLDGNYTEHCSDVRVEQVDLVDLRSFKSKSADFFFIGTAESANIFRRRYCPFKSIEIFIIITLSQ